MSAPTQRQSPDTPVILPSEKPPLGRMVPRKRVEKFAWRWADSLWIVVIAASCALMVPHSSLLRTAVGIAVDFLAASGAYVAGLRMHSRSAGTTAALLVASSQNFAWMCGTHPTAGALSCAVMLAIAGYAVNWPFVTYLAAFGAGALGFNGILIGALIAIVSLVQKRRRAVLGALLIVLFDLLWYLFLARVSLPTGVRPWHTWRDGRDMIGLGLFILWFMAPFYAEATLKGARERWLLGLCLVAAVVFIVFTSSTAIVPQLYVALPVMSLVVGVGLGRLLPLIAGEYPKPAQRYFAATAAVLLTLLGKFLLEPPLTQMVGTPDITVAPLIKMLPRDSVALSGRAEKFYWTWISRLTR